MKHELPGKVVEPKPTTPKATCGGCGKKEQRGLGLLGLPSGWIGYFSPLFGKPWSGEFCSMHCKNAARLRDATDPKWR